MPYKCSVPACRGNYDDSNKVAVFSFPPDQILREKWIHALPRKDFTITKHSKVCEKHFKDGEIIRNTTFYVETTGELLSAPLKRPKLKENAIPSIFHGCPSYLSSASTSLRESPLKKKQRIEQAQIELAVTESVKSKIKYDEENKFSNFAEMKNCIDSHTSLHMNQFASNANLASLTPNHMPAFKAGSNSPLADRLSVQNQMIPPIQMPNMNIRPAHSNVMGQLHAISHLHMIPHLFFHFVNPSGQVMPIMGNNHLVTSASQFSFSSHVDSSSLSKKSSTPPLFSPMLGTNLRQQAPSKGMPSVTITPLSKLQGPYPVPMAKPATASGSASMQSNSLVVCEICDGYITDLEQLHTHMQLIHKVKIQPKVLVSRPPFNCQKCQWRFFTDQGLERHLLGAHGLVTSNMQELANKDKDAGCCTICGRVYSSKLVSHMNQVHKITLKPAHPSYKCTVCSATFNLYRLFENHVYLVHSGAAKRSADGRSSPSKRIKCLDDSITDLESSNHKQKCSSKDIGDENCNKCKECGNDKKSQNGKCDKCLKSDELVQGTNLSTKTLNDELRKTEKTIEKAGA